MVTIRCSGMHIKLVKASARIGLISPNYQCISVRCVYAKRQTFKRKRSEQLNRAGRGTRWIALGLSCIAAGAVTAQTASVTGSLVDVANAANFNALERAAARANQATYNTLVTSCGGDRVTADCNDGELSVFRNSQELVQTANELLGSGPTQYSLGSDSEGLGFALRWTAAEELAGQGSATTKFAASQLSALATRLAVLRWGVSGPRRASNDSADSDGRVASTDGQGALGGGASADFIQGHRWGTFVDASFGYGSKDPTDLEDAFDFDSQEVTVGFDTRLAVLRWGVSGPRRASNDSADSDGRVASTDGQGALGGGASADFIQGHRWGTFVDASFGYGSKDPTDLEDAFDFDSQEVTVGFDYRFGPAFVAGVMLGYSDKEIDFDSSKSIVDGGILSDGFSGIAFAMLEGERAYVTGSIGYQQLTHDTTRRITYPSFNPSIASVDSTSTSSADSSAFLATASAGYPFRRGRFAIEPSIDISYTDISVAAFTESSRDNQAGSSDDPFDLRVGEQSIESLVVTPAIKLQYVFMPRFGVLIPYLIGRYHRELSDDARAITSQYADAIEKLGGTAGTDFAVTTDQPDEAYYTASSGLTVVLGSGLNGYVQYLRVLELEDYSDSVITGGFRYEF